MARLYNSIKAAWVGLDAAVLRPYLPARIAAA